MTAEKMGPPRRAKIGALAAAILVLTLDSAASVPNARAAESQPAEVARPAQLAQPAKGGRDIIAAAEDALAVVVGKISNVEKVDLHGYAADLMIDLSLAGKLRPPANVRIAWEELAPSRPVRFRQGDRVLVCLQEIPNYTLWKKRFPSDGGMVLAVANEGEAFVREPDGRTTHLLEHYLELGSDGREDPAGFAYLAEMSAGAQEAVAVQALARLAATEGLSGRLPASGVREIIAAASDANRPLSVRRSALGVIAEARLMSAREAVHSLAADDSPVLPEALASLASLDGGLPAERVDELLESDDGRLREIGVEYLEGDEASDRLAALLSSDSRARVRAAAARRLLAREGDDALDAVLPLLGDEDPVVRMTIARESAAFGESVVPRLVKLADQGTERQAQGAVLALTMAGRSGGVALAGLAKTHENPKIRALAELALGKAPGHSH